MDAGVTLETVEYNGSKFAISFISWDVGGRERFRSVLRRTYQQANALIFVVDSNDRDQVEISRDQIMGMLSTEALE